MSSDLKDELTDFFNWRPPSLYASPTATESTGTRDPTLSFYNKLLAKNFILRRVRSLPSLPKDIEGTVDKSLDAISARNIKLPPYSEYFPTKSFRSHVRNARTLAMKNEWSVAEFYGTTTALFCVNVASVLALQPMVPSFPKWLNVLFWTATGLSKSGYAIADGSLRIMSMDSPDSEVYRLLSKSDLWLHLQQVREALEDLAIWEFKSLSVGDHTIMTGIRSEALTGIPFRWETMDNGELERVRRRYEPPPIGPDASVTPWELTLPGSDSNENSNSEQGYGIGQSALQPLPGEKSTEIQAEQRPVSPIRFSSSPLSSVPSTHDKSEASEQGSGQIVQPSQGESSTATQITGTRGKSRGRGRAKSRGRSRGGPQGLAPGSLSSKKRKRDDDDENYKTKQELTAARFIQQVRYFL